MTTIIQDRTPNNGHADWSHSSFTVDHCHRHDIVPSKTMASLDLAWHHIIPFADLRTLWNTMLVIGSANEIVALVDFLSQCQIGPTWTSIKDKLKATKSAIMSPETAPSKTYEGWETNFNNNLNGTLPQEMRLTGDEQDALFQAISWSQWNIVEGPLPQHRRNDPGNENLDDFRGLKNYVNPSGHLEKIHTFYQAIQNLSTWRRANWSTAYVTNTATAQARSISDLVAANMNLFKGKPLVAYDPKHWVHTTIQSHGRTENETKTITGLEWYVWDINK